MSYGSAYGRGMPGGFGSSGMFGFQPTSQSPAFQRGMGSALQRLQMMPQFQRGPVGMYGRSGGQWGIPPQDGRFGTQPPPPNMGFNPNAGGPMVPPNNRGTTDFHWGEPDAAQTAIAPQTGGGMPRSEAFNGGGGTGQPQTGGAYPGMQGTRDAYNAGPDGNTGAVSTSNPNDMLAQYRGMRGGIDYGPSQEQVPPGMGGRFDQYRGLAGSNPNGVTEGGSLNLGGGQPSWYGQPQTGGMTPAEGFINQPRMPVNLAPPQQNLAQQNYNSVAGFQMPQSLQSQPQQSQPQSSGMFANVLPGISQTPTAGGYANPWGFSQQQLGPSFNPGGSPRGGYFGNNMQYVPNVGNARNGLDDMARWGQNWDSQPFTRGPLIR
jgi:hypothetical protein